ncbi:MAG: hypothetical protein ACRDN0_30805 [Trebonia sp.]
MDPPELAVSAPRTCRTCRGPVRPGYAQCYQCDLAVQTAPGLLADVVAPIAYAVKGGDLARDLRWYKSGREDAAQPRKRLADMLAGFLRSHGDEVWRAAGMTGPPGAVAVVPSGQGRPGDHPLLQVVTTVTAPLPVIPLSVRPGEAARGRVVTTRWLRVHGQPAALAQAAQPEGLAAQPAGLDVLLVDDTWVSGASAQSAAAALKLAGAARVAAVVLGRHIDPADPRAADFARKIPGLNASNSSFFSLGNCIHLIARYAVLAGNDHSLR